jgi:hypothetical protein
MSYEIINKINIISVQGKKLDFKDEKIINTIKADVMPKLNEALLKHFNKFKIIIQTNCEVRYVEETKAETPKAKK